MSLLYTGVSVGGGLPPIRWCQPHMKQLTHRYRGQVESSHRPSHILTAFYWGRLV
ncbi:hypothetical protein PS664_05318 [Pseudomonas fluorescens]|nr:hypothetical protein PS664_05318 [Pseudomonas fluorescens]